MRSQTRSWLLAVLLMAVMALLGSGCWKEAVEASRQRHEDAKEVATDAVDSDKGKAVSGIVNTTVKLAGVTVTPKTPDKDGDGGWGWILTYGFAYILGLKPEEDDPKDQKET